MIKVILGESNAREADLERYPDGYSGRFCTFTSGPTRAVGRSSPSGDQQEKPEGERPTIYYSRGTSLPTIPIAQDIPY